VNPVRPAPLRRRTRPCGWFLPVVLISLALLMLSGCATTRVRMSGQVPAQPLCQGPDERISALIVWSPEWRPDQKDVLLREAAAHRGIERFFATSRCFASFRVIRQVGKRSPSDLPPPEIPALAAADPTTFDRRLVITVRELGPLVKLFASPALLEGGTEVLLQVRSLSPANGHIGADFTTHWQDGGPWVIKGVATLEDDIACALEKALRPSGEQFCPTAKVDE
jgi:hypothetical protein